MAVEYLVHRAALRPPWLAAGCLAAAAAGLLAGLRFSGAIAEPVPGLPDAGAVTAWGLPLARTAAELSAVLTVGALLLVVALLPSPTAKLSRARVGAVTAASVAAAVWALSAVATVALTASDLLAQPLGQVLEPGVLADVATTAPQGQAWALTALAAVTVATFGPGVGTHRGAGAVLAVAVAGLLPPAFAGHSAAAGNHDAAVVSLMVHMVAVTVWVGGLLAVLILAVKARRQAAQAAARFSVLAGWCLLAVAASGLANAAIRLGSPDQLVTTRYGLLLVAKTAAVAVLAWCGRRHRRRTLPMLHSGRRRAFVRLAAGEVLLMAATMGLAVALSRSPAPATAPEPFSPVQELTGFPMPDPVSAVRLLTTWRLDAVFALGVCVAALAYWRAVRRLQARGDSWPVGRTVAWMTGLALVVVTTMSGLAVYGKVMFSVHMGQHMTLAMAVPIFLVLGAPVTLALRALPAAPRGAARRGPREMLLAVLHSHANKVLTHPVTAMALFIGSSFTVYFTPLFEIGMRSHFGHLAMQAHFLLIGLLFYWTVIGVDPAPHRIPHFAKLMVLVAAMPFHSFFAISLMSSTDLIAAGHFQALNRPWGGTLADDQYRGGAIAWATGDIPMLLTTITLAMQWVRSDAREARRVDRAIDRGDGKDPLTAYNAYLAALHVRDRRTPDR